jgi:hypothetical protein
MNMVPSYSVSDHNYDAMHCVGNILEDMVKLVCGKQRLFSSDKLKFYIDYEQSVNMRFLEWQDDQASSAPFVLMPGLDTVIMDRMHRANTTCHQDWKDSTR